MSLFDDDIFFEIYDSGDFVKITPLNYMFQSAELDWDRNWILADINVKAGVFNGQYRTELMTVDFEVFKQGFKKLDSDFIGEALFKPLEEQLVLKIKGDGLGHFNVECSATPDSNMPRTLEFEITFDQTEIKKLVHQLEKIAKKFPRIGNP